MVNYQYAYAAWTFLFFIVWTAFYLWRKDVRKEMLFISILFGFGGPASELIYIQDWWQPLTLTGTAVGFEDFFIAFFIAGVSSAIYEVVSEKRIRIKRAALKNKNNENKLFLFFAFFLILLFFGSFYIFKINSFYSSVLAFGLAAIIMYFKRRDLIIDSLLSGFFTLVVGISIYFILSLIYPDFIQQFWYLKDSWFAKLIFGIPIAEYIWYFLAGAYIGPLYEFWKEGTLIDKKN